jgi:carotenoid cleavage dioxygenase
VTVPAPPAPPSKPPPNPYLVGNFAPVRDERDDADLEVTGAIPPELDGLLLRNGPNPILDPDPAMYHWFLGDGMLHGIELHAGKARYRNRWVRTATASEALGEPVPKGPREVNGVGSSASTAVVVYADRILALYEASLPTEVRADLSTVGAFDFGGSLTSTFTAHPKVDPITGEMLFFGSDALGPPFLRYHVVDANGALVRSEDIELPGPVMMHDWGVTSTRVVFLDLPVGFDVNLLGTQPFPFAWQPERGARVGVMPRTGGSDDVVWIDIDPCYVYHVMNSFDDADGNVVIDLVRYPDMFVTDSYGPGATSGATLDRWTIDPRARTMTTERLDDVSQEFPRVDDRFAGRVHRYGYAAEVATDDHWSAFAALRKHDLASGKVEHHEVGPGRGAGEPVFVPAAPDAGEDHGWVLSVVYDAARDGSDMLVVDATDFKATPVATIHLPRRVPFGFHGTWVAGASLD